MTIRMNLRDYLENFRPRFKRECPGEVHEPCSWVSLYDKDNLLRIRFSHRDEGIREKTETSIAEIERAYSK